MAVINRVKNFLHYQIRGKWRRANGVDPLRPYQQGGFMPELADGIYQIRKRKGGFIQVREKFYQPSDQTQPNKVARQNVFRDAVVAWQNLTADQKKIYHKKSSKTHLCAYNYFLKEYLKRH